MKEGSKTTEYKLAKASVITSVILPVAAYCVEMLQASGAVTSPLWVSVVAVVGAVLSSLGYSAARTMQKGAEQKREALTIASMMQGRAELSEKKL